MAAEHIVHHFDCHRMDGQERRTLQAIFARWLHAADQEDVSPATQVRGAAACVGNTGRWGRHGGGGYGAMEGCSNLLSLRGTGLFASPANMSRVRFACKVNSALIVTAGKAGASVTPGAMAPRAAANHWQAGCLG